MMKLENIAKDAAERAAKNASVAPELLYAPILWALQDSALSDPAAVDSNASAEAITDDQITYANELAEDRRRAWANASAEARLREALGEIEQLCCHLRHGGPDLMDLEELSDALEQATQIATEALSPDPHASDCEKQGETTKSEGGGQVAPAKCSATGVHPTDTSCAAEPEVAPGPSDRPADVTYHELHAFLLEHGEDWNDEGQAARALLNAFTVGRR